MYLMPDFTTFTAPSAGKFLLWSNNADTVGIRTEWAHNRNSSTYREVVDIDEVSESVKILRVDYCVHAFLHRTETWAKTIDNSRRVRPIIGTSWAFDAFDYHLTRRDDSITHGSPAAKEKAIKLILTPLAEWLDTPAGVAFTAQGEEDDRNAIVARLDANVEELETAVRNLLRIKAKIAQGKNVTPDEKSFARYVRLTNNLGDKR